MLLTTLIFYLLTSRYTIIEYVMLQQKHNCIYMRQTYHVTAMCLNKTSLEYIPKIYFVTRIFYNPLSDGDMVVQPLPYLYPPTGKYNLI